MSKTTISNHTKLTSVALLGAAALLLTACSGSQPPSNASEGTGDASPLFVQDLHDSLPDNIKSAGTVKVAAALSDQLFSHRDGEEVVGIIPDLAEQVGEVLGVDFEFVDTTFPGMIPALQADRVDLIWTTMNDTAEREEALDFVDWVNTSSSFMVAPENPENIESIEDVCGLRVATLRGAVPFIELLEAQSAKCEADGEAAIDLKLYDDFPSGQTQLRSGQIDTFFGPTEKLNYIIASSDGASGFEVVEKSYLGGVYGIGVQKDKPELSNAMLEALKVLSEEGIYDEVLADWENGDLAFTLEEFQINGVGAGAFE